MGDLVKISGVKADVSKAGGPEQSLVIDHEFKHRTWDNDKNGQNILRISVDHSFGLADGDIRIDIRIDCGVLFFPPKPVKSNSAAWQPGSQALGDVGLQWEASMSTFLGQTGRVKTVQMKEGKQVVEA